VGVVCVGYLSLQRRFLLLLSLRYIEYSSHAWTKNVKFKTIVDLKMCRLFKKYMCTYRPFIYSLCPVPLLSELYSNRVSRLVLSSIIVAT
jgi:hypothetical protein